MTPLRHNMPTPSRRLFALVSLLVTFALAAVQPAIARTITLGADQIDRMAAIDVTAPELSWAMQRDARATFHTVAMELTEGRSMLLRFNVDQIPANQRIVHAELVVPVTRVSGNEPRFYLWRTLADWGAGVSHLYRSTRDKKVEWARPGARGVSSDRAARPSGIVRVPDPSRSEKVINVTEDVEIWYGKRAANFGWILSVEDPGVAVEVESLLWTERPAWSLRITYEPGPTKTEGNK